MHLRPIVTLHNAVGVVLLAYAVGVLATPNGGAMGYLTAQIGLTAPVLAVVFAACGLAILIARPNPPLFSLLTTPILLYSFASLGFLLSPEGGALTAYFAHFGVWLVANAAIADRARDIPWNL